MIDLFPQIAAQLVRPSNTYSAGRVVEGTATTTNITVAVPQPASQRDLQMLPEGERSFDHRKTYTATEVRNRDQLIAQGLTYKVVAVGPWFDPDDMRSFYKVILFEVTNAN